MSNNQKYVVLITSILTVVLGFVFNIVFDEIEGILIAGPYVMIGVGCGVSGGLGGELLSKRASRRNPDLIESIRIEQNDERNIQIKNKAKAKVLDMIMYLLGPIYIGLAFLSINLVPILILIALNIAGVFYMTHLISRYNKEM